MLRKRRFTAMRARSMRKLRALMKPRDAERERGETERDERTEDSSPK